MKPLFDNIFIEEEKKENKSGIIIPDEVNKVKNVGKVISIGPDVNHVKSGDKVIYDSSMQDTFKIKEEKLTVIKESDIIALCE